MGYLSLFDEWSVEEAGPDGGVEDTGADLDVTAGFAPFVHQFGDDIRIVFIKGIIDRLVKDFGLVLRAVVVIMCARDARHRVQRWPGQDSVSWM